MVLNQEIVLFRQSLFCFFHQLQLFLDEIAIIDDFSALGANKMMVMLLLVLAPELVTTLAVARSDFLNKPQPMEQFQGAVDGRQTEARIHGNQGTVDFLCAHMSG